MKQLLPSTPRWTHFGVSLAALSLFLPVAARGAQTVMPPPIPESASEPVRWVGKKQTDKRFYDGALRHAVDVHKCQTMRGTVGE